MGLNLNYEPSVVVNISGLTEEKWLDYRRKGIGGSDASAIMGDSPWNTVVDLYNDKVGIKPAIDEEDNAFAKDYGHTVEPLIARWFAKTMTGMQVYKDDNMYLHPLYPFMLADLDYRIRLDNGKEGILEIKSTTYRNSKEWQNGQLPVYYEEQVRHYMCVMNLDFVWVCCLWGNNFDSDSAKIYVERDLAYEEMLIKNEAVFWKLVQNKTPPTYAGSKPDLALKSLRKYIGSSDNTLPAVTLPDSLADNLDKYIQLTQNKSQLNDEIKYIEKQINVLSVPVVNHLQKAENGILELPDATYTISYPSKFRATFDRKKCQKLYPDVFKELSGKSESRSLSVTRTERTA